MTALSQLHVSLNAMHRLLLRCLVACAGMTGSLVVKGVKSHQYKNFKVDESEWPPRYWKLALTLEGDVSIAFADPRRSDHIGEPGHHFI